MNAALKIVGAIVVCLILLLVIFRITGLEPHGGIPGLWLKGNLVTAPVVDWSFTDQIPNIKLQTRTSYLLPHSVTVDCLSVNGQLYLTSAYPATTRHEWNYIVQRYPQVRLKIGDNLYDRTLVLVTDPAERAAVLQARKKKYPKLKILPGWTVFIFHVVG